MGGFFNVQIYRLINVRLLMCNIRVNLSISNCANSLDVMCFLICIKKRKRSFLIKNRCAIHQTYSTEVHFQIRTLTNRHIKVSLLSQPFPHAPYDCSQAYGLRTGYSFQDFPIAFW